MFDFSFGELLLLAVVALIFIGPKELPVVLKAVARALAYLKSMTRELKGAMDDLARESGLKDAQNDIEREMRMITGDDGKQYPAYDLNDFFPSENPTTPPSP